MLGLLLDAVVLCGLVMLLNQDDDSQEDDSQEFWKALAAAGVIGLLILAAGVLLRPLGLLAFGIIIPGAAIITASVLWIVFGVKPLKAAMGGGMFLIYKIAVSVVFAFLFST